MNNRERGTTEEQLAADFYEAQGYTVLQKNYRRKTGEIDLIVRSEKILVFCEVKYRKTLKYGDPAEAVTAEKQARIYRTAQWYLKENRIPLNAPMRFDVVSITGNQIRLIENAFGGF